VHRLVAREGWDDLVFTLFSARLPENENRLLVTPFPRTCRNVTASSLIENDLDGVPTNGGSIDEGGFPLYGAIHKARPDVNCILHLHTIAGTAVASSIDGLQPISQTAMIMLDDLAYFDYRGIGQGDDLVATEVGSKNNVILRNHGTISLGQTVAQAFGRIYTLERACAIQTAVSSGGQTPSTVDAETVASVAEVGKHYLAGNVMDEAWEDLVAVLDTEEADFRG
jgi:ribulose-5-phosphate 4-epimerase/fuculose-1-phosphate aldolase